MRLLAGVMGVVLVTDWGTKLWAQRALDRSIPVPLVGDYLRLTYIHNKGAAFGLSLGAGTEPIFLAFTLLAFGAIVLLYLLHPPSPRYQRVALALIAGGALGNLGDRIRLGEVVDFLDVGVGDLRWPIFNVADVAVTCGAILLTGGLLFGRRRAHPCPGPTPSILSSSPLGPPDASIATSPEPSPSPARESRN